MQIVVTTDSNVEGTDELIGEIEAAVEEKLSRFSDRLTRVEVHLGDENAQKAGADDKRCMVEARPAGLKPVAVTSHASTVDDACKGALHKLVNLLERRFERLSEHKGAATIRRGEEI